MRKPEKVREMRLISPAKINLGLRILGLRPDNFHEVETWMQQVALYDRIRIRTARRVIRVAADRKDVPSGRENLAYRAAAALREEAGDRRLGASIFLEKHIPAGAGLGGGSGNAAAVLWGLNRLWGLGLPPARLFRIAAGLGSDVPFFLAWPAGMCRGRGERVSRRGPLRSGWVLLVKPPLSLSTERVYGWMRNYLKNEGRAATIEPCPKQTKTPDDRNDLEQVVFERYPILSECRNILLSSGARRARMSGSGPALWGLFRKQSDARAAGLVFSRRRRWRVHVVKPLTASAASSRFHESG